MFGVVCDIDGVLVKEHQVIKGATSALKRFISSKDKFKVPFLFVTNGGNCTETMRADGLSKSLEISDITRGRMIVSHSPLQAVGKFQKQNLLLVGSDESIIHQIADQYNWKTFQTAQSLSKQKPFLFPQRPFTNPQGMLNSPIHRQKLFDSVIILSTPSDWAETLQLLVDILLPFDNKQTVELYAANPDLVYSSEYCTPRFTTGAFVSCLSHLYEQFTGISLCVNWVGKPYKSTYSFAEQKLLESVPNLKRIYAIGDNPLSDIKGANDAGEKWYSILVLSGVHSKPENHPEYPAKFICSDISEAIEHILNKENFD